ncbi:GSCFA domain-containing protein [Flavobacterium sp. PLA-1-15]|uniref:GSCFA domain-containing protein n=1 Tax=Flavobacterium sp. PLA-1-15 TaxID=3380533 RepID=UPI003B7DB6FE
MQFRTQIPISKSNCQIDYNSKIVSIGSCFAENIGDKFEYFKFQNTVNPFGIIFNPVSIEKIVRRVVEKDYYTGKDVFFANGRWHCFEVHSELSSSDKESFIEKLNQLIEHVFIAISQSTHIIVTYGTSWVYREKEYSEIVANCHKLPQKQFDKELLSVEVNQNSIRSTIDMVHQLNPDASLVFTVSPVRHIKDGFVENQISKAQLITALHSSISGFPSSSYFPSYEIMMDELRDYRFYAEDMLHPNQTAIDYIWKLFAEAHFSTETFSVMTLVENIQKAINHRPFDENGAEHQKFLSNLQDKIKKIQEKVPHIRF